MTLFRTGRARDEAYGSLALYSIKFKINQDSVTFVVNLSAFFFISLKKIISRVALARRSVGRLI